MKFPRVVKVGADKYKIRSMLKTERDKDYMGLCCYANKTIYLNTEYKEELPSTLLHELLHAIISERNLPAKREEELVVGLERGLMQVFAENPKIVDFIFSGFKK